MEGGISAISAKSDRLVPIFRFHGDLWTFSNGSCGLEAAPKVWPNFWGPKHPRSNGLSPRYHVEYHWLISKMVWVWLTQLLDNIKNVMSMTYPTVRQFSEHNFRTNTFLSRSSNRPSWFGFLSTVSCNEPRALSPHESMSACTFSCECEVWLVTCAYLRRIQLSTTHLADMLLLVHLSSTSSTKHILYHPDKTSHKAIVSPYSSNISNTYIRFVYRDHLPSGPPMVQQHLLVWPPGLFFWAAFWMGIGWGWYGNTMGGTMIHRWDNMVDACEMYCSEMLWTVIWIFWNHIHELVLTCRQILWWLWCLG